MLKTLIAPAALALLLIPATATEADAQGVGIHFGKHGKRTSVGVSINVGNVGGPVVAPFPPPRPVFRRPHRRVNHCPPQRVWVPGHYDVVTEQVWIPGGVRREWCPPVYRTEFDACGNPIQVLVAPGHFKDVCVPGHYETVTRRVWVPGHWR